VRLLRAALASILLSQGVQAALLAHVETTRGTITAELKFDEAPLAVANFITLAEGTRNHLDPETGAVSDEPYYIGESFYRVINEATFRIAQTGSGTGTNAGGPGYTFPDEFDAGLRHVPYVLSMANSGPNSNGSQIFFVGNSSPSHLDDVHTVFGIVQDPASRAVIDAIHEAGNDATSIVAVTFERTDAAAMAFDELAQALPTVSVPPGEFVVTPGVSARYQLFPPASTGDILHARRSVDLDSWTVAASHHLGIEAPAAPAELTELPLGEATGTHGFYHVALARHPGALAPSHFRGRTLSFDDAGGRYTFAFHESGESGGVIYTPTTGNPFSSSFTVFEVSTTAHAFTMVTDAPGFNPRNLLIKAGCDAATTESVIGRHSTQYFNAGWRFYAEGEFDLTR